MGRFVPLLGCACLLLCYTTPAAAADSVTGPPAIRATAIDEPDGEPVPGDPLSCVARVAIPTIEQVTTARWALDGAQLAFTRIVRSPSRKTITGYEEDLALGVLDVDRGTVVDLGLGTRPEWSASGRYLSYWREGTLMIRRDGRTVARIEPTAPDVRWVGEQLEYWSGARIRVWDEIQDVVLSEVDPDYAPRYPTDDVYFSGTGRLFALTRYRIDGSAYRYVGETRNGQLAPVELPGTTYTEWAPAGETLLVRSNDRVELRSSGGDAHAAPLSQFPGPVHGWTPDGKALLMGKITPTLSQVTAFDRFAVWDGRGGTGVATLPNLLGSRSFSPDGRYFSGTARTSLSGMALEVYRCGTSASVDGVRADPVARARQPLVADDGRRFALPVIGWVSQFLQGYHTGVDVAAPVGSVITAADGGLVSFVGWIPVGGRAVCVDHGSGLETCYYHTSLAYVSVGQRVARGEPVAAIGMTGLTTGAHVHWEAKLNGMIVDPLSR